MRKTAYSALLIALSLASLSAAADGAAIAQAAPGVPAADTARPGTRPPETVRKPDTATATVAAPAPAPDTSASRSVGDTSGAAASAAPVPADSAAAASALDTAQAGAKPKKRKRVVRETTVNTIDELKGRYRSPKKALFMSLLVPGLGQAYVGQHWFNYARGAGYLMIDVGLLLGWNHYVNTKQDRQIRNYRRFADENWSLSRYEDVIAKNTGPGFDERNPNRVTYCQSVQNRQGNGSALYQACLDPAGAGRQTDYNTFTSLHSDEGLEADTIGEMRAEFPNSLTFYELIGKYPEFVTGWKDAEGYVIRDTSAITDSAGNPYTTDLRQEYIAMRAKANDYARMQAWFLGGMVLNHIVSALDAAFAANIHNKSLYQTEVGFLERLRFDSGLAWDGPLPRTTVTASLTF